jgi:hypothetical protein
MRVSLCGGTPTTLAPVVGVPLGVAVDATSVYWTAAPGPHTTGTVMKVPVGGGTPVTLASGQATPLAIAVDSTSVYWTNFGSADGWTASGPGPANGNGAIMKIPLGGGVPTTLASVPYDAPQSIALDATSVYWTTYYGGAVMKAPLGGGAPTTLNYGPPLGFGIAVDSTSVYWLGGHAIRKVPLSGGAVSTLATFGDDDGVGIAVDSTNVYCTVDLAVLSVPLSGGTLTTLASGPPVAPVFISVDRTGVYWGNDGSPINGCTVMKLAL